MEEALNAKILKYLVHTVVTLAHTKFPVESKSPGLTGPKIFLCSS